MQFNVPWVYVVVALLGFLGTLAWSAQMRLTVLP